MITNARKQTLCEAHKDLLNLIWVLGKGLMYKKHIEAYMEHFFEEKPQNSWKIIKELEESELVERVKLYNIVVIKLKKYAIRFLLGGVERESIRSIEVTANKLNRTAYINATVLYHIKTAPAITKLNYETFLDKYCSRSTFFTARNQAYQALERNPAFSSDVTGEIAKLKGIQLKSTSFIEMKADEKVKEYLFNINSMEQGSVFIDYTTKKAIHIAILDDKNNLTGGKIAEKVMRTYDYLSDFLDLETDFIFKVYVRNENRLNVLNNKTNQRAFEGFVAKNSNKLVYRPQFCHLRYVNLDLDKNLFGNQLLVLTGSVKSKVQKKFEETNTLRD